MAKPRFNVLFGVEQGLTEAQGAKKYWVTWRWVTELVSRYKHDGELGLNPDLGRHTNKH